MQYYYGVLLKLIFCFSLFDSLLSLSLSCNIPAPPLADRTLEVHRGDRERANRATARERARIARRREA